MRLITRTNINKIWGKSRSWVNGICKPGMPLEGAIANGRIDVQSPAYARWAKSQGFIHTDNDKLIPCKVEEVASPGAVVVIDGDRTTQLDNGSSEAMGEILDMRLRDVMIHFGERGEFSGWLSDVKKAEDIREKRLKNEQTEGSLISREGVRSHVMGLLEELSRRLLLDGAQTITRRCYAAARGGVAIEDSEKEVRLMLTQNLRKARDGVTKKLKKL